MGVSNSEMLDLNSLEINFLEKPTLLEFQDHHECDEMEPLLKGDDDHDQDQDQEEDKCKVMVASLNMKIPSSSGEFNKVEEDFDGGGFKTPTTLDHKIPVVLQCPPAPRKPKSRPLLTKRKLESQRRIILYDLSKEIEALFPPALLADLGNKIKKAKQEN